MPGVGFPRWNVELLKVRNGKPGSWQIEWAESRFQDISYRGMDIQEKQNQAGWNIQVLLRVAILTL